MSYSSLACLLILLILSKFRKVHGFTLPRPGIAFLDRDGVINVDVGPPGVIHEQDLHLIPNAADAISQLQKMGYKCCVVTNQSCVGKGFITEEQLHRIHGKLQKMLLESNPNAKLDGIYFCTSLNNSGDLRMKPFPGMIYEALNKYNVTPECCFLIGDSIRDLQAAAAAEIPLRILVETGYGKGIMHNKNAPEKGFELVEIHQSSFEESCILPFYYCKNLFEAVHEVSKKIKGMHAL